MEVGRKKSIPVIGKRKTESVESRKTAMIGRPELIMKL